MPPELSAELASAGLYRLCVPASLGGGEAPPAELLGAIEELARGDAAAGWCVAVCATAGMLAAYLEPEAASEVFGDPSSVVGGVFAPMGRAAGEGGELVVGGRWRFCSNIDNCDWLMGGCVARRRRAAPARQRAAGHPPGADARARGRGDRHLVGGRAAGDRQPRLHRRRTLGAGGAVGFADRRPAARAARSTRSRPSDCSPPRLPPSPSGPPAAPSTNSAHSPPPRRRRRLPRARRAGRDPVPSGPRRGGLRSARSFLYERTHEAWDTAQCGAASPLELRAGLRSPPPTPSSRGEGRRPGLLARRQLRALHGKPPPAAVPRRPRGGPAHAGRAGDLGARGTLAAGSRLRHRAALSGAANELRPPAE